jgi:hypothetical protein
MTEVQNTMTLKEAKKNMRALTDEQLHDLAKAQMYHLVAYITEKKGKEYEDGMFYNDDGDATFAAVESARNLVELVTVQRFNRDKQISRRIRSEHTCSRQRGNL